MFSSGQPSQRCEKCHFSLIILAHPDQVTDKRATDLWRNVGSAHDYSAEFCGVKLNPQKRVAYASWQSWRHLLLPSLQTPQGYFIVGNYRVFQPYWDS